MPRAALVIVLSGLVAACGQPSQTAEATSSPALDFIEATPIAEGSLIEGPGSPRPVVTQVAATPAPAIEKGADKEEVEAAKAPGSTAEAGTGALSTPPARPAPAPAPAAKPPSDETAPVARREATPSDTVGEAVNPAASPPPQTQN